MPARLLAFAALVLFVVADPVSADGKDKKDKDKSDAPKKGETTADPDPIGRPKSLKAGNPAQFYVWYNAKNAQWHLATTTAAKDRHTFSGKVTVTGGTFGDLQFVRPEMKGKNGDAFKFNAARTFFEIQFVTAGGEDEVHFPVSATATDLTFDLKVEGGAVPRLISIGKDGDHPTAAKFTLPAKPTKK